MPFSSSSHDVAAVQDVTAEVKAIPTDWRILRFLKQGSSNCKEEVKVLAHCVLQPSLVKLLNCNLKYSALSNKVSTVLKNRK